METLNRKI